MLEVFRDYGNCEHEYTFSAPTTTTTSTDTTPNSDQADENRIVVTIPNPRRSSRLHDRQTTSNKEDSQNPAHKKGYVRVDTTILRVNVYFDHTHHVLPQSIVVTEDLHWKMVRQPPRVPVGGFRSEALRGDPSRAQISAEALKYYEEWMASEKEVRESGEDIRRLSLETRQRIQARAHKLLEHTVLPMRVRSVTIYSFGTIPTNWSTYHSDKYIWPIGFKYVLSF